MKRLRTDKFNGDIEELFKIQDRLDKHLTYWEDRHNEYFHKSYLVSEEPGFSLIIEVYEKQ